MMVGLHDGVVVRNITQQEEGSGFKFDRGLPELSMFYSTLNTLKWLIVVKVNG